MFDSLSHRRVALVSLVAFVTLAPFAALSGAAASAPATADVSPTNTNPNETATDEAFVTLVGGETLAVESTTETIRGVTTADPGTTLTVEAENTDQRFLVSYGAVVREDGSFDVTLDFDELDSGTEFELSIFGATTPEYETTGTVVESASDSQSVLFLDDELALRSADDQTVRMLTNADPGAELTVELRADGNFVAEARAPVAENGTARASLDLRRFDPGTEFAVVAPDGSRAEGVVVEESALPTTTVSTANDGSEFATTTTATATATDAPADDETAGRDENVEDVTLPGFGAPAALVALLAAFAVARARRP